MKITALIKQSLKSISSNKVRSSLTVLGIVIGIAAVISLVGLGKGLQTSVTSSISNLGTTDITIQSQDPERQTSQREAGGGGMPGGGGGMRGGFNFGGGNTASITVDEYEFIKNHDGIALASPSESSQVAVTKSEDSDMASQYQLFGIDTDYLELNDLEIAEGAMLTQAQIDNGDKVVLIGKDAAEELFEDESAVGKTILFDDTEYTIVGVLQQKESESEEQGSGQMGGMRGGPGGIGRVTSSFITGYKTWLTETEGEKLSSISARAENEDVVEEVATAIETKLFANRDVTDTDKADVAVTTSDDLLSTVSSVATSFTSTLTGIAAISLLVGGIGIMNIMLVTVTERTREIGLRRALGAKSRHIVYQFLLESLLLTLIGGLIGVGIGVAFGSNLTSLISTGFGGMGAGGSSTQVVIDFSTILLAVGISMGIGILFGLFPALKAAKLDPVEALRYE